MVANGDVAKKVWGTEYGAATSGWGAVSETTQADFICEAYAAFAGWSWTGTLLWYSYRDQGTNPLDREDNFGFVRHDFSSKESSAAFVATMAAVDATSPATTTTTAAPATTTTMIVSVTTTTTVPGQRGRHK